MLVLVIIGLMSSAVVMSLPKDPPASQAVSEGLLKRFNQTAQTSLLSGETAAFGASKTALVMYGYDGTDWIVADTVNWPDDLRVSLQKDGQDIKLTQDTPPLIIFEPTGSSSVFTLTLSDFEGRYVLSSKGDGRVLLESGS